MNRDYLLHRNATILQIGQSPSQEAVDVLARSLDAETLWGPFEVAPDPTRHRIVKGRITPRDDIEERETEAAWMALRQQRNRLLAESDHTQLPDVPGDRQDWVAYRQALRDLPDTTNNPINVTWPEPPETDGQANDVRNSQAET